MTSSTTVTLMAVITALNVDDSLVPSTSRRVITETITKAPQSTVCPAISVVPPANPKTVPR